MHIRRRRYTVVASVAFLLVLAAACSSSTSPTPATTPAQLAEQFDAIYSTDLAAGTSADSNAARNVAEYAELAPAYGASEASFTVTTASGTQAWHGVAYAIAENATDTVYILGLYPNRSLQTALLVLIEMSNGTSEGALAAISVNGLISGPDDSVTTGTATTLSTGATCSEQSGLVADAYLTEYLAGESCESAKFQASFSAVFQAADGLGALESVSATNATFNGALFQPSGGSHMVAIPSKAAGLLETAARGLLLHRAR
jgi:hypothetical protein